MRSASGWLKKTRGSLRVGLSLALTALVVIPALLWADAPAWWAERGVLKPGATPDDYAAVNQGQVKNIAKQAYEEMKAKLPTGAGSTLSAIWETPATSTDDYRAINLGQLKNVAEPFYARLQELSYTGQPLASGQTRPWSGTADDFALANVGQVKNLFSFDLSALAPANNNILVLLSGDQQVGLSGQVLPQALTVRVLNEQGIPVAGVSVVFTVTTGSGTLGATGAGGTAVTITAVSGLAGQAIAHLEVVGSAGAVNIVTASAMSQSVSFFEYIQGAVVSEIGGSQPPTSSGGESPNPGGDPSGMAINDSLSNTWDPKEVPSTPRIVAKFKEYDAPFLKWDSSYEQDLIQRRVDCSDEWVDMAIVSSKEYRDGSLLTGHVYEYRVLGVLNESAHAYTSPSGIRAYDVPLARSADGFPVPSGGWAPWVYFGDYSGRDEYVDPDPYVPDDSGEWTHWYYYWEDSYPAWGDEAGWTSDNAIGGFTDMHSWGGEASPEYTIDGNSVFYQYSMDCYGGDRPISWIQRLLTDYDATTFAQKSGASSSVVITHFGIVDMFDDSPYYVNYRGARLSAYSIPTDGLKVRRGEHVSIEGHFIEKDPYDGATSVLPCQATWSGTGISATVDLDGSVLPVGSGVSADRLVVEFNDNAKPGHSSTFTLHPPDTAVSLASVPELKFSYVGASDDAGVNIPASESSGAKYRKIALNGAPLSDEKPQQASESDQPSEETFIDALTLGLRHDTTDIYTSVPASDLSLSVRRSASTEIWNLKNGLRPEERPDRPFGPGWTTNLAANIHFTHGVGEANEDGSNPDTATVTDENGAEYTFAILYGPDASYTNDDGYTGTRTFVPLPNSNHEQSTHLCSLTEGPDNTYIFRRKFGSILTYSMTALKMGVAADRIYGSSSGTNHTYARLDVINDRYGNGLSYGYSSGNTIVPATIRVRKANGSSGAVLSIRQNTNGHITDIWDPSGYKVHYDYTAVSYADAAPITGTSTTISCATLNVVTAADGKQTHYNLQITPEADQNPNLRANVGNYYHLDLTGITDPLNHSYGFSYVVDHTKYDYSSDAPGDCYYIKTGLPLQVRQTTLPDGTHATFTNESSNLKVAHNTTTGVETMMAGYVRRNYVVDALGNQRTYNFTNPSVETLPSFATAYKHEVKFDNPRLVYYQTMTISAAGGSETFTFSPESGMSVTSATDFSGNTTTYAYDDVFTNDAFAQADAASLYNRYSDPTSQTNALGKSKHFTYGANRIMTSSTDEAGVTTQWTVDSLGRRTEEQTPLQDTLFTYGNTTFPNLMTKKTVKKQGTADPSWVTDLVTLYVPDANGRIAQEVVDMNGNGTIEPSIDLVTAHTYDANGNKLTTTDPRGNVTTFSYDVRNRLTHVTYADHHQKRFYYDDRGNKTKEIDENGVATFWEYDALNRVVNQVTDLNGNGVIDRLAGGLPDRTKDIVVSYTYNALNAKLTTTGPKGTVTKFEYDALQRLTRKTDDLGGLNYVTSYEYDKTKNPGGSVFDSSGWKPTKVTDPRGYTTEVTYDKLYRPKTETVQYAPGAYATTTKDYDDVGNLTQVTAPAATGQSTGTITKTAYDALRRPTSVTEGFGTSLAATTTKAYTSTGLAWKTVDPLGRTTTIEYDHAGRPVKTYAPAVVDALSTSTTPVSPVTETHYDAAGNVSYVINPLLQRTDYSYDNLNRRQTEQLPSVTDATTGLASRPTHTTAYDGVGNVIAVQDARGWITTTDYDNARRPWRVTAPPMTLANGTTVHPVTQSTYDKAGNVLTVTDANGHVTTNTYDALNRLKTTIQKPDANAAHDILVTTEYDSAGNRTAVIDGKSQRTEFTYDGLNRNLTVKDPALKVVTFTYDAVNKTARVDSETHRTEYTYDGRHRLEDVTYIGRTADNRHYDYDLAGQLLAVTESGKGGKADVAYTYDALGRQLTETSGGQTHTYGYDLASNRVKVTYGGTGTVLASTYDALNRLKTLTETQVSGLSPQVSRLTTYGYDLNGNRVLQQLPNGEEVDTQYDALNRASAITTSKSSGALLSQLTQAYDPVGNLVKLTERHYGSTLVPRTVNNAYDAVNRLTGEVNVEGTKTVATTYGFDPANNRTAKAVATTTGSGTALVETAYAYNNLNQLQTATTGTAVTSYSYDLNGSRLTATLVNAPNAPPLTDTYSYDYENRLVGLTKATTGGAGTYAYVYDYRTRRVERTESGTTTKSIFSGGLSVAEYTATTQSPLAYSPSPNAEYIRGSDWGGGVGGLLYSVRSGVPSFKHYNSRGDVISETNATGAATWEGTYEAFGKRTQEVGTAQDRQKANTKEEDPTGLLNEGFRYRDLETGAFITRDPLGFVDGPNMYAYVVQNPWSKFDPMGLEASDNDRKWFDEHDTNHDGRIYAHEIKGRPPESVRANFNITASKDPNRVFLPPGSTGYEQVYNGKLLSQRMEGRSPEEKHAQAYDIMTKGLAPAGFVGTWNGAEPLRGPSMMPPVAEEAAQANVGARQAKAGTAPAPTANPAAENVAVRVNPLTPSQTRQIQAFTDRFGAEVNVVGSRASGTARATSDFDYAIQGNAKLRNSAEHYLPRGSAGGANNRGIDIFKEPLDPSRPFIQFTPNQPPVVSP